VAGAARLLRGKKKPSVWGGGEEVRERYVSKAEAARSGRGDTQQQPKAAALFA
jgi:hypothetical protein